MSLADRTTQSLYEHPEGTNEMPQDPDGSRSICGIQTCKEFVEVCRGLHPYLSTRALMPGTLNAPPGHFPFLVPTSSRATRAT